MRNMSSLIILASLFMMLSQSSCSANATPSRPTDNRFSKRTLSPEKAARIQEIREKLSSGPQGCNSHDGFQRCQSQRLQVKLSQVQSDAPKVMIMEQLTVPHSVFAKNHDRVLEFVRLKDNHLGTMERWRPEVAVPTLLTELSPLLSIKGVPLTPEELEPVGQDLLSLHKKFQWIQPSVTPIGHGNYVFDWIADLTPGAQFVFAEFPEPGRDLFCSLDTRIGVANYAKFYDKAGAEMEAVVHRNQIDFINVSYASTEESLSTHFRNICGKNFMRIPEAFRKMIIHSKARFVQRLTQVRDVLVLQAVPNHYPYEINPDMNPFVCGMNPQILHVGFFVEYASRIPIEGIKLNDNLIHSAQWNLKPCTDVWINGGMVENTHNDSDFEPAVPVRFDEHSLYYSLHGVYRYPVAVMATSWATPIALSMMIRIQEKMESSMGVRPSSRELKEQVLGKMMDPVRHRIFKNF